MTKNEAPPPPVSDVPSIYGLIVAQLDTSPDTTLDVEGFPPLRVTQDSDVQFAPGLMDQLFGGPSEDDDQWMRVLDVVREVNRGQLSSWLAVERKLDGISAAEHVDRVLDGLTPRDATPQMKKAFWELARGSASYEAVKWGVALGGMKITPEETDSLLILARHPEFTVFSSHVLERESAHSPQLRGKLIELLPLAYQWGVISVINYIVRDSALVGRPEVQRAIVVYGMENNGGIPMEVAFTIASAIDFELVSAMAASDERLFQSVVELVDTLITEPAPLGGLTDLPNPRRVYEQFRSLLAGQPPSIAGLSGWKSLAVLLEDQELNWEGRALHASEVRAELAERLSPDLLREGLDLPRYRWTALGFALDFKVESLLPAVGEVFEAHPDSRSIEVLAALGGIAGLALLLSAIPRLVDLPARRRIPLRAVNSFGPEHRYNFEYAKIIELLGGLNTPEAIAAITEAAGDYAPVVRQGACSAIGSLPAESVTEELRRLLRERLEDPVEWVAAAAASAAQAVELEA